MARIPPGAYQTATRAAKLKAIIQVGKLGMMDFITGSGKNRESQPMECLKMTRCFVHVVAIGLVYTHWQAPPVYLNVMPVVSPVLLLRFPVLNGGQADSICYDSISGSLLLQRRN